MTQTKRILLLCAFAAVLAAYLFWPQPQVVPAAAGPGAGSEMVQVAVPETLSAQAQLGRALFEQKCIACHGRNGAGNDGVGPPLIHKIYEPSHHGDESFQRAVAQGVQRHHWRFGNMMPVDGLTRADVAGIVTYIRELQRANGIN